MKYCELEVLFATASPRRRELAGKLKSVNPDGDLLSALNARGFSRVKPIFVAQNVKETVRGGAEDTAVANARLKGESALSSCSVPVLAFDTAVGVGGAVFGKPKTREQAISMLFELCGRTHEVVTAVFFAFDGKIIEKNQKTYVTFGAFDKDLVYNYVDSGAPYDKAGGYNIEDAAILPLVERVDGDRYNVAGLPVALTEKLIEEYLIYGENGHSH